MRSAAQKLVFHLRPAEASSEYGVVMARVRITLFIGGKMSLYHAMRLGHVSVNTVYRRTCLPIALCVDGMCSYKNGFGVRSSYCPMNWEHVTAFPNVLIAHTRFSLCFGGTVHVS